MSIGIFEAQTYFCLPSDVSILLSGGKTDIMKLTRKGCRDVWNAYMCEGADFSRSSNDIPFCPTTATELPTTIIPWEEAKRLYRNALARGDKHFFCDAFVCWFIDDYKFDGSRGIWHDSAFVLLLHQ